MSENASSAVVRSTPRQRRGGRATVRAWALGRGFNPSTVHSVLRRWLHRRDASPQGVMATEILTTYRRDFAPAEAADE